MVRIHVLKRVGRSIGFDLRAWQVDFRAAPQREWSRLWGRYVHVKVCDLGDPLRWGRRRVGESRVSRSFGRLKLTRFEFQFFWNNRRRVPRRVETWGLRECACLDLPERFGISIVPNSIPSIHVHAYRMAPGIPKPDSIPRLVAVPPDPPVFGTPIDAPAHGSIHGSTTSY